MRRKYIVAVLLLLSLGIMSTLALSYTEDELTENWDTLYTLQYGTSDLALSDGSDLETSGVEEPSGHNNDLQVIIPATSGSVEVTPKITVTPIHDASGAGIYTDDSGTFDIDVYLRDASKNVLDTETISITITGTTQITGTATFSTGYTNIAYVDIHFDFPAAAEFGSASTPSGNSFESYYNGLQLTVEDA